MLFERYMIRKINNDDNTDVINIGINEGLFEEVTIDTDVLELFSQRVVYSFENASYDNLIVLYSKPEVVNRNENGYDMYKLKIAYVKTKDEQVIVNVNDWDVINHLDEFQGLIDYLEVFLIPYDNYIKIAVEYKYQSLNSRALMSCLEKIVINGFINHEVEFDETLEIVKDYFQTDFEATFNGSRKSKKLIFHIDTVNNLNETMNSARMEYSIKADTSFENTMAFINANWADNISRYTIKCQDNDEKTATIDGHNADLMTDEWMKPARTNIEVSELTEGVLSSLNYFLRDIDNA